jgi:hypothetical protein
MEPTLEELLEQAENVEESYKDTLSNIIHEQELLQESREDHHKLLSTARSAVAGIKAAIVFRGSMA